MNFFRIDFRNVVFGLAFYGLFLAAPLGAQEMAAKQPFTFPKYALEFQIQTIRDFTSIKGLNGLMFSGRLRIGQRSALRLGITENTRHDKITSNGYRVWFGTNNDTLNLSTKSTQQRTLHGLRLDYLFYPFPDHTIKWYVGGGPGFSFDLINEKGYAKKSERKIFLYSLKIITGVEWFIEKKLSLHLEYGLEAYYEHSSYSDDRNLFSKTSKSDIFNITPSNIVLGFSLYFQ